MLAVRSSSGAVVGLAALIAACTPLRDLDAVVGDGSSAAGASGNGGASGDGGASGNGGATGGLAGAGGGPVDREPPPAAWEPLPIAAGCGDGVVGAGEACDEAGATTTCLADCSGPPDCLPACECGVVEGALGSHYYMFCDDARRRDRAQTTCRGQGMHLARIDDERENDNLIRRARAAGLTSSWVGLASRDSDWVWDDGGPLVDDEGGATFADWRDEDGDGASCVTLRPSGGSGQESGWYASSCSQEHGYICESYRPILEGCGDGMVAGSEACDLEGSDVGCDADCSAAACGDGTMNPSQGESCDDGNASDLDACRADCSGPGLVAWWRLDHHGDGTLVYDSGPSRLDGTIQGAAEWQGVGLAFDGDGEFVDLSGYRDTLNLTGPFTMTLWVRASTSSGESILFGNVDPGATTGTGFALRFLQLGGIFGAGEFAGVNVGAEDANGATWVHLALRHEADDWSFYYDGGQRQTRVGFPVAPGDAEWRIGQASDGSQVFPGTIADVRVFGRALEESEIVALGQTPSEPFGD